VELTDGCYSEGDSQGLPGFIHPRVQGKPGPKRGGVNCCRQRLGSRERMKDVHVLRRVKGLL